MTRLALAVRTLTRLIFLNKKQGAGGEPQKVMAVPPKSSHRSQCQKTAALPLKKAGSRAERIAAHQARPKVSTNGNGQKTHEPEVAVYNGVSRLGIDDLLPIDELVPSGHDPECVKAVIYWGFLRPSRSSPLVNGNYGPYEHVVGAVTKKGYTHPDVVAVIKMFERQGLVYDHPHAGSLKMISLITKTKELDSAYARQIARISSAALFQMKHAH